MASQTLVPIVCRGILGRGLVVGIVTALATHLPSAGAIALTQCHRGVVFQEIRVWWRTAQKRNSKNPHRVIQRRTGAKVGIVSAWLQDSRVSPLMAIHANIIRQP